MPALTDHLLLKVVSHITDAVTTTDELIPSGETSSFRSNPLRLAEFTLSRKDPAYVGLAKAVHEAEIAREAGKCPCEADGALCDVYEKLSAKFAGLDPKDIVIGSTIYANKPGDGSAREQAASCQRVLGGAANLAREYATKRYRSNLINWGMIPFLVENADDYAVGDYIFVPNVREGILHGGDIPAYIVGETLREVTFRVGELTPDEKQIILDGCLINYYRNN